MIETATIWLTMHPFLSTFQGIVYYLWQLIAEHHSSKMYGKTRILNSTSPVARVVGLSPGSYTFSLTVLDSHFQSSSDSMQVTVLAGKEGGKGKWEERKLC